MKMVMWTPLVILCLAFPSTVSSADVSDMQLFGKIQELEQLLQQQEARMKAQDEQIAAHTVELDAVHTRRLSGAAGAMDHIWLILCGALVMFMQAGFAMLEAGCCRAKNVQNIMLKNLTDVAVGTVCWYAVGYAFAYGSTKYDDEGNGYLDNHFIGVEKFFGHDFLETTADDSSQTPADDYLSRAWFFQWAFCSAAATIVSGGIAERVNFFGYCIYSIAMTAFIYPVVVAWTWGYGWLASEVNDIGYMDFAGSGIVHMSGGVGALVGACVVGPRKDRFTQGRESEFAPHSLPLIVLGTFILWFGWYGFNCGSTLGLSDAATGALAAHVAMNTTIAAAVGGLTVFIIKMIMLRGLYDVGAFCNGILAGLVSITAPCGNVECGSAVAIAAIGGIIYVLTSELLKKIGVDDPIDAFAVHGACGAWGVLAAAIFDWGKGFDSVNGWEGFGCVNDGKPTPACQTGVWGDLLVANLCEIGAIAAWVGGLSLIVMLPLRLVGALRADDDAQEAGMDTRKHSPPKAYNIQGAEQ